MRRKKPDFDTVKALKQELNKEIDNRDHISSMIKSYTDDWVASQKKIIDIQETLTKLNENERY